MTGIRATTLSEVSLLSGTLKSQTGANVRVGITPKAQLATRWRQSGCYNEPKKLSRMGSVRQPLPGVVSALRFLTPFEATESGEPR